MEVSRIRALRGPNLWTRQTAIEAIVSCGVDERMIDAIPGFEPRLRTRFPEIGPLRVVGDAGPVAATHVLEQASLGLQMRIGCPVTFSRTSATLEPGVYQVVVEYTEESVGRLAFDIALRLYQSALNDTAFDLTAELTRLRALDEDVRLGPSTGSIVTAAMARGIPYCRLTEGSLVQFGWGSKQRRIQAAEVDRTSAVAEQIAQDKELTKRLLTAAGVPVPDGRPVRDIEDAWQLMQQIGGAVVVKPRDGNQGKGVAVNVTTREHLEVAYAAAAEISSDVMLERFIPGNDFRLLVVGDQLVAASRRDSPYVIGDGERTIRALVDEINTDPRRGDGHATALTKIRIDELAIARLEVQGYTPDSVPGLGVRVILRNNANLSTGGTATDVTDDVHPELAARAVEAAKMIGLDIAGVDVVTETVLKPLEQQGGGIVEVNAAPGLRMHLSPSYGKPRNVGEAIVSMAFADGEDARIPVIAVTGTNGKTTTVRLISHMLACSGLRVGMTNTDGVYVNGRQTDSGDCSGPKSARNVLLHPDVDAAVFETARGGILREGLGFDRCKVGVVTNVGKGDHLGLNFITSAEELGVLKRVIVQNVAPDGYAVLNANDPIVAAMANTCPGSVIFFGNDRSLPVLVRHRAKGNRCVYVEGGSIVVSSGRRERRLSLADIPLTKGGALSFQVENTMAAIAAAWALDIDWKAIEQALASFRSDIGTVPGRFNEFSYRGATIIADYGHNPDAMIALAQAVEAMPGNRRIVVISGAGDRRDEDIREQTQILGHVFDEAILYQDQAQRGRADGEVISLLREGLVGATRTKHVEEIHGEFIAIDAALDRLGQGDLCLILIDQVDEALAHLRAKVAAG